MLIVAIANVLGMGLSPTYPPPRLDPPPATQASAPSTGRPDTLAAWPGKVQLTPFQLFALAQDAVEQGDYAFAENGLRALMTNPDAEVRSEARFRLAMLLAYQKHKLRDAATLLRQILDEKPRAVRVRIELAKIQSALGNTASAQLELRAAQAAGLPPDVERDVRFFMQALDNHRHVGASIEATLMPDTNANRATAATTIDTALGGLSLSRDAQKHSGLGGNVRALAYARVNVSSDVKMLAQMSSAATIFPDRDFDDFTLSPRVGPEFSWHRDRLTLLAGPSWRWYATLPYTAMVTASATWQHTLNPRTQLRTDASVGSVANRLDHGQSGAQYALTLGIDRAMTARMGVGVQLNTFRQTANLAAYALTGGGASAYAFREIGHVTASLNLAYSHLEADEALILFPDRRIDNAVNATAAVTLRTIRIANVSPIIRIRYEKNHSNVEIYNYNRLSGEIGFTASF